VIVVTLNRHRRPPSAAAKAAGVDYDGETIALLREQLEAVAPRASKAESTSIPWGCCCRPAGARNAVDWRAVGYLTAKQRRQPILDIGRPPAKFRGGFTTSITLGIDTDAAVAAGARRHADWPLIKVKSRRRTPPRCRAPGGARHVPPRESSSIRIRPWDCDLLKPAGAGNCRRSAWCLSSSRCRAAKTPVCAATPAAWRFAADESVADRAGLHSVKDLYRVVNVETRQDRRAHRGSRAGRATPARWGCQVYGRVHGGDVIGPWRPAWSSGNWRSSWTWTVRCCTPRTERTASNMIEGLMQLPSTALWGLIKMPRIPLPVALLDCLLADRTVGGSSVGRGRKRRLQPQRRAATRPSMSSLPTAHVIDGTGSPWYTADVGIREGTYRGHRQLDPCDGETPHRRRGQGLSRRASSTCWGNRNSPSWSIRACRPKSTRASPRKLPARAIRRRR